MYRTCSTPTLLMVESSNTAVVSIVVSHPQYLSGLFHYSEPTSYLLFLKAPPITPRFPVYTCIMGHGVVHILTQVCVLSSHVRSRRKKRYYPYTPITRYVFRTARRTAASSPVLQARRFHKNVFQAFSWRYASASFLFRSSPTHVLGYKLLVQNNCSTAVVWVQLDTVVKGGGLL